MADEISEISVGGNTRAPTSRARTWFLTWNNPEISEISALQHYADDHHWQMEKGESGTEHLQGVVRFKNQKTFNALKKDWPKIHWEKCKSWKAALDYCWKDETCIGGRASSVWEVIKDPLEPYMEELHWWQQDVLKLIDEEPDDRSIYWFWEKEGNVGKTSLAKHICLKRKDAIYVSGKAADVKFGISQMKKKPKIVVWDLVRSRQQYISWEGIEEVKNGICFNTKYESGMMLYNCPHVICFANFPPQEDALSGDRWKIVNIDSK